MNPFTPNTEGIFKMPADQYHAAPGVGKHSLDYVAKSPLDFALLKQYGFVGTEAMELSTICHTATLEPELLEAARGNFHELPDEYPSTDKKGVTTMKEWSGNSKWCKAWKAQHADKPCKSREAIDGMLERARRIARNVREHPSVGPLFVDGFAEQSIFARCPLTGMLRKGRPDWMTEGEDKSTWIVDTKFVADASEQSFRRQVQDLRYYVQHAYYVDMCVLSMGGNPDELETVMGGGGLSWQRLGGMDIHFILVAVEKEPMHPKSDIHRVQPYELPATCVEMGRRHYTEDLRTYARCCETGVWPSNTDKIKPLELAGWFMKQGAM